MDEKIREFYNKNKQIDLNGEIDDNVMKKVSKIMRDSEESMKIEDLVDIIDIAVDLYTCTMLLHNFSQEELFKKIMDTQKKNIIDLECYQLYVRSIFSQAEKANTRHKMEYEEFRQLTINMAKARWQEMNEKEKANNILYMEKEIKKEFFDANLT